MGELTICSHDFENAKRKLKEFSERKTADVQLGQVDAGKDLGEFAWDFVCGRGFGLDHRVTGEELNELTSKIQEKLIDLNKTQIELIQEFREVYNALEALDRDYIYGDVLSLSAVEKQSQVLAREQESIKKITEDLKTNGAVLKQEQEKNDAMLLELSKTAKVLTLFKQRLEQCAHLEEIDKMWEALSEQERAVRKTETELKTLLQAPFEAQEIRLEKLEQQNEALEAAVRKSVENEAAARAEIEQKQEAVIEALNRKIKNTYWLGGSSAAAALISIVMLLRMSS